MNSGGGAKAKPNFAITSSASSIAYGDWNDGSSDVVNDIPTVAR